jgi:hypothetical protein
MTDLLLQIAITFGLLVCLAAVWWLTQQDQKDGTRGRFGCGGCGTDSESCLPSAAPPRRESAPHHEPPQSPTPSS